VNDPEPERNDKGSANGSIHDEPVPEHNDEGST
jgi:hypothetical protein